MRMLIKKGKIMLKYETEKETKTETETGREQAFWQESGKQ